MDAPLHGNNPAAPRGSAADGAAHLPKNGGPGEQSSDMAKNGGSGRTPPPSPIDEAPTFEPEKPLSLLMDTGAMTHVAGCGRRALPGNVSTEGFNVRGVGGGVARMAKSIAGHRGEEHRGSAVDMAKSRLQAPPAPRPGRTPE